MHAMPRPLWAAQQHPDHAALGLPCWAALPQSPSAVPMHLGGPSNVARTRECECTGKSMDTYIERAENAGVLGTEDGPVAPRGGNSLGCVTVVH